MQYFKCKNCKKLLFKYDIHVGEVEIICTRCGNKNRLEARLKPDVKVKIVKE